MATEEIVLEGHIIDSLTLPRVMDAIVYQNGDFEVVEIRVGRTRDANDRPFAVFVSHATREDYLADCEND